MSAPLCGFVGDAPPGRPRKKCSPLENRTSDPPKVLAESLGEFRWNALVAGILGNLANDTGESALQRRVPHGWTSRIQFLGVERVLAAVVIPIGVSEVLQ